MFGLFNGIGWSSPLLRHMHLYLEVWLTVLRIVRPYDAMPVFWKYWMYYVNPSTYWIGGILAATLDGAPVECAVKETARFDAPPNQTCQDYAGAFAQSAGGYLLNPDASSDCQYCPYSNGNQYLQTLHINADEKWRGESDQLRPKS